MTDGWSLPEELMSWIWANIPDSSTILEFGSGNGSLKLSEKYDLISIEHDPEWLHLSNGRYIHAPIVENKSSSSFSESGWYDIEKLVDLPTFFDAIIVDGPTGTIGRSGILEYIDQMPRCDYLIIDDTDREPEQNLASIMIERLEPTSIEEIQSKSPRHGGTFRSATILKMS